jgi:methylase of polypeptide subunit release factors
MRSFIKFREISVVFESALDGGGSTFGQEFIQVVADRIGPSQHVFEFCAGPGFIGFSLPAHGLCEQLTLADINPKAVLACRSTIQINRLEDGCYAYVSDVFDSIPKTEKWDLIVGNPPHWPQSFIVENRPHWPQSLYDERDLRNHDIGLGIHRRFFEHARSFLKPGGSILLQENSLATTQLDFECMISDGGFHLVDVSKQTRIPPSIFFFAPEYLFHAER